MSLTGFLPCEGEPLCLDVVIEPAIDANGRNGRDEGNEGVRLGCGLAVDVELLRDDDDARGEDTNAEERVESKCEEYPDIAVVAIRKQKNI